MRATLKLKSWKSKDISVKVTCSAMAIAMKMHRKKGLSYEGAPYAVFLNKLVPYYEGENMNWFLIALYFHDLNLDELIGTLGKPLASKVMKEMESVTTAKTNYERENN